MEKSKYGHKPIRNEKTEKAQSAVMRQFNEEEYIEMLGALHQIANPRESLLRAHEESGEDRFPMYAVDYLSNCPEYLRGLADTAIMIFTGRRKKEREERMTEMSQPGFIEKEISKLEYLKSIPLEDRINAYMGMKSNQGEDPERSVAEDPQSEKENPAT